MAETINVQNNLAMANMQPDEASSNLNDAALLGMNSDAYSDDKEIFQPQIEKQKAPAFAQPQVAKKIVSSRTIASVMKPNVKELNDSEQGFLGLGQLWGKTKKRVDYGADMRRMNDLGSRWLSNGRLSGREEAEFQILKSRTEKFMRDNPDYSKDFFTTDYLSTLPSTIADVVTDQVRGLVNEGGIVAGATATGAAVGGTAGLVAAGPAAAVPSAVAGGVSGFTTGLKIAQGVDSFKQTRGQIANELRVASNPQTGQPLNLPVNTIAQVSNGTAALVAGFDALSFSSITKGAKWVRQSLKMPLADLAMKVAGRSVTTPTEQLKVSVIRKLGTVAATEGGTEAIQEIFQQIGTALGESWNGNETQFWSAASRVSDEYSKNIKTLAKEGKVTGKLRNTVESALVGAAAGPTTSVALGAATAPIPSVIGAVRNRRQQATPTLPSVTQERIPGMPMVEKGQKAIEAKVVLDELVKLTGKTELQRLQPGEMSDLIKNQAVSAGIPHMWADPQSMQDWAGTDEKKQAALQKILGSRASQDAQLNAPFQVDTQLVVEMIREFPDFSDNIKAESNGLTYKQLSQFQSDIKRRQEEILQRPGRQAENLSPDDELLSTIQSREQADAAISDYLKGVTDILDKAKADGRMLSEEDQKAIDDQNRLIKKLQNNRTFLPTEAELAGGTQLSFEDRFDRKKGLEAEQVNLTAQNTDAEIADQLATQEGAQAYINRLDRELVNEIANTPEGSENPRVQEIQDLKARAQAVMDILPSETLEVDPSFVIDSAIDESRPDFLIPPELRAALPPDDVRAIEEGEGAARDFTTDEIKDIAQNEMLTVVDAVEAAAREAEQDQIEDDLSTNPNIETVENFLQSSNLAPDIRESLVIDNQLPKTYPAYAISPNTLTEEQRQRYLEDPTLVARKAFHKKGISGREAANIMGVKDVDTLLQILSQTPSRDEAMEQIMQRREAAIANEAGFSTDLNETSVIKRLNDRNAVNKRVLDFMRNTKEGWRGLKSAIKVVTFPTPKSEEIRDQANKKIFSETKINQLDLRQYKIGENRSRRKSGQLLVQGDLEAAFLEKQSEMQNVELQRSTLLATAQVNRRVRKLSRLLSDRNIERLKKAGEKYLAAHVEITDVFNLDPRVKGEGVANAWVQMADFAVKAGQGDLRIPPGILESYDPRTPWNALTPDQFIYLVDKLDNLSKLAQQKNTYVGEYRKGILKMNTAMMRSAVEFNAQQNPRYNPENVLKTELRDQSIFQKVANNLSTLSSVLLANTQYITLELDNGQINGFFQDTIWNRLLGIGKWEGPYGQRQRDRMRGDLRAVWDSEIKQYGKKEFLDMGAKKIEVPEFAGIEKLNFGKMRKIDLFVMACHVGNESNFNELTKFGVTSDTVWNVLERELTIKDMTFIQNAVWNVFKALEPRVVALERIDNQDITLIPPREFVFKGKVFPGGYFHITREDLTQERSDQQRLLSADWGEFAPNYAARGMTAQGYTEARVENDQNISLSATTIAYGFDEVINDLAMRIPVRDTYKIITDKENRKNIISVVGQSKYKIMTDAIASQTRSDDARRMYSQIHGEAFLDRMANRLASVEAISTLAGNLTSILIQPVSLITTIERMGGTKAIKHFVNVAGKMSAPWNYQYLPQAYQFVQQLDPGIENYRQNIDDNLMSGISNLLPVRGRSKTMNMIVGSKDFSITRLMGLMGSMDVSIKSWSGLAAYSQFMAGEAPGFDMEKISAMSDTDREIEAQTYAANISGLSLTQGSELFKSNFQRTLAGRIFGRYFNDARNAINSAFQSQRDLGNSFDKAVRLAKDGDLEGSAQAFTDTGSKVLQMVILTAAAATFETVLRGQVPEDDEEITPAYLTDQLITQRYLQNYPLIRDIKFGLDTGRAPTVPLYRTLANVGQGISGFFAFGSNYVEYMNVQEAAAELNKEQFKGMLSTTSYLLGGVPVTGPWKWGEALITQGQAPTAKAEATLLGGAAAIFNQMKKFIMKNDGNAELQPVVDQVKQDIVNLPGVSNFVGITDQDLAAIRQAENPGGQWDATNEATGAFGHYQIIESTWKDIVNRAPKSLGLTEDGLYEEDGEQAEKGARWYANEIARQLKNKGIEPTLSNIYGGWHFGAAGWSRIAKAAASTKKGNVLSESAMNANPWTRKKDIKTAGDVVAFIRRYIGNARLRSLQTDVAENQ